MPYGKRGIASSLAKLAIGAAAATVSRRSRSAKAKAPAAASTRTGSRRRTTGRTVTRRKKSRETSAPSGEYTNNAVALGRKAGHGLRDVWKLLNANKSSTIFGYRGYSQFGGTQGIFGLVNVSPSASLGPLEVPLHLWEITSAVNTVGGTITYPNWFWKLAFSDPTATAANVTWTNSMQPTIENADSSATIIDNLPSGSSTLDWMSARLLFYNSLTLPTRYQIDVVQIKDTRLMPETASVNTATPFHVAFWQAMVKRFTQNPLETGDTKYQKYLKVLHSQSFILNPKETTETVNTIMRQISIFMRLNRRCTYDWQDSAKMGMLNLSTQVNLDGAIQTQVHPRARIFLMIRAQARNGTAYSTNIHPSYDVVLRTKHTQFTS